MQHTALALVCGIAWLFSTLLYQHNILLCQHTVVLSQVPFNHTMAGSQQAGHANPSYTLSHDASVVVWRMKAAVLCCVARPCLAIPALQVGPGPGVPGARSQPCHHCGG